MTDGSKKPMSNRVKQQIIASFSLPDLSWEINRLENNYISFRVLSTGGGGGGKLPPQKFY